MEFDIALLSDEEREMFRVVRHICRNFSKIPSIDEVDRKRLALTASYLDYFLRTDSTSDESAPGRLPGPEEAG